MDRIRERIERKKKGYRRKWVMDEWMNKRWKKLKQGKNRMEKELSNGWMSGLKEKK